MKGYLSHGSPDGITETLEDMKSEGLAVEPAHLGLLLEAYSNWCVCVYTNVFCVVCIQLCVCAVCVLIVCSNVYTCLFCLSV